MAGPTFEAGLCFVIILCEAELTLCATVHAAWICCFTYPHPVDLGSTSATLPWQAFVDGCSSPIYISLRHAKELEYSPSIETPGSHLPW